MKRFTLLCLSIYWLFVASGSLHAAGIAVISRADITPYHIAIEAFRTQIGLPLQEYHLGIKNEHQDEVRQAITAQQPELILALGKSALTFSRKTHSDVPVIFSFVLHPEQVHESDDRLQHHESGIAMLIHAAQQFKTLLTIVPGIKNIGVVYDPSKSAAIIQQAKTAAKKLGINLMAIPISNQKEAAYAIADTFRKTDAMWMVPDTTVLTSTTFRQMIRLSLTHAVALIGLAPKHVRAGSLFSLSFDSRAIGQQAGRMAKRMLQGKKLPPLLSPDATHFVVNVKTADRLGLKIPPRLLKEASHVYPKSNGERH